MAKYRITFQEKQNQQKTLLSMIITSNDTVLDKEGLLQLKIGGCIDNDCYEDIISSQEQIHNVNINDPTIQSIKKSIEEVADSDGELEKLLKLLTQRNLIYVRPNKVDIKALQEIIKKFEANDGDIEITTENIKDNSQKSIRIHKYNIKSCIFEILSSNYIMYKAKYPDLTIDDITNANEAQPSSFEPQIIGTYPYKRMFSINEITYMHGSQTIELSNVEYDETEINDSKQIYLRANYTKTEENSPEKSVNREVKICISVSPKNKKSSADSDAITDIAF